MILKRIHTPEIFAALASSHIGVFGTFKWLSIYGEALQLIGIYKDEHQLIGGFYFLKIKKYGFSFIKLPPYTPHCGLFFKSENSNQSSKNNFSKELMDEVCQFISQQNAALTILAFPSSINDFQPFIWNKFKVVPNYTYRIQLENSMENIISNFDSKNRNAINKAIKEELVTEINGLTKLELFDFFYKSLKATDANIYEQELKRIFLNFSDDSNSFSIAARLKGDLIGLVFCVYDENTCYYLLGGVNKNVRVGGVTNLLIQKSIERAKQLGCKIFDFEGSMLKGVEKFFRGFGPELVPYFTVNKAKLPIEMALKFKKRELF